MVIPEGTGVYHHRDGTPYPQEEERKR